VSTTLTARLHSACVKCIACIASSGIWDIKKHGATEHAELPGHLCTIPEISPIAPNDSISDAMFGGLCQVPPVCSNRLTTQVLYVLALVTTMTSPMPPVSVQHAAQFYCATTACSKGIHRSQIRHPFSFRIFWFCLIGAVG
jgi:hypothetical protein